MNLDELLKTDKVIGKCKFCHAKEMYFTGYLSPSMPNVECRNCGKQWTECPKHHLLIIKNKKKAKSQGVLTFELVKK